MTRLDLAVGEELSSSFEPCQRIISKNSPLRSPAMLAYHFTRTVVQLNLYRYSNLLLGDKQDKAIVYGVLQHLPVAPGKAHSRHIETVVNDVATSPESIFPAPACQVGPGIAPCWIALYIATGAAATATAFKVPAPFCILGNKANIVPLLSCLILEGDSVNLAVRDAALLEESHAGWPGTHASASPQDAWAH